MRAAISPPVPPGRLLELPGRGTTFVREVPAPTGAPTLVLLHGWTATADLNWCTAFSALSHHYGVVAIDHRGHGRGIRSAEPFRLEDCADDTAAALAELGVASAVVVGYSMGGAIAQLMWQRHPRSTEGLVLCATSTHFSESTRERMLFSALGATSRLARVASGEQRGRVAMRLMEGRATPSIMREWAVAQLESHDWLKVMEAGRAVARFDSRPWVADVDVPTAVVVTMADTVVPTRRQLELAEAIPGASVHGVEFDHAVCLKRPQLFVPSLMEALGAVAPAAASAV